MRHGEDRKDVVCNEHNIHYISFTPHRQSHFSTHDDPLSTLHDTSKHPATRLEQIDHDKNASTPPCVAIGGLPATRHPRFTPFLYQRIRHGLLRAGRTASSRGLGDCSEGLRRETGSVSPNSSDSRQECLTFRLSKGITASQYLVGDLRNFNKQQWAIRYPSIKAESGEPACEFRFSGSRS